MRPGTKYPSDKYSDSGLNPSENEYDKEFNSIISEPAMRDVDDGGDAIARDYKISEENPVEVPKGDASMDEASPIPYEQPQISQAPSKNGYLRGKLKAALWATGGKKAATLLSSAGIISVMGWFGFTSVEIGQFLSFANSLSGVHFAAGDEESHFTMGRLYRFMRSGGDFGELRVGYWGSKTVKNMKADLELMGLKPEYGSFNTYKGFSMDTKSAKSPFRGMRDEQALKMLANEGIDTSKAYTGSNGKLILPADGPLQKRSQINILGKMLGKGKIAGWWSSRSMRLAGWVTFHPLDNLEVRAIEKIKGWWDARKQRIAEGRSERTSIGSAKETTTDQDGNTTTSDSPEAQSSAESTLGDEAKIKSALKSLKTGVGTGVGAIGAASAVTCVLRTVADNYDLTQHNDVVLPMIRMGTELVSASSQIQSNIDISFTMLEQYRKVFNTYDSQGHVISNWHDSLSINKELNGINKGTPPLDNMKNIEGGMPSWLSWTTGDSIGTICSTSVQAALTVVDIIITATSGGLLSNAVTQVAMYFALPHIIQALTDLVTGNAIDPDSSGADYGNMVNYGIKLAANSKSMSFGGQGLSPSQTSALRKDAEDNAMQEMRNRDLMSRLFDIRNSRSLVTYAFRDSNSFMPTGNISLPQFASGVGRKLAGDITSGLLLPAAAAKSYGYDYGFRTIGTSLEDQENSEVADPYANAEKVGVMLDSTEGPKIIESAQNCFGVKIEKTDHGWGATFTNLDAEGTDVMPYSEKYLSNPECKRTDTDWLRVRAFIRDDRIMLGYACYNGFEEACQEIMPESITSEGVGAEFNIATSNILGASHTGNDSSRLEQTIKIFQEHDLDVIGMQEFQPSQQQQFINQVGSTYDMYPKPGEYSPNAIVWNKSKFTAIENESGKMPNLLYFGGSKQDAPYVKLRTTEGQTFYVMNVHDPAGHKTEASDSFQANSQRRTHNAREHVKFATELHQKDPDSPIFLTGDFNSKFTDVGGTSNGYVASGNIDDLPYCILGSSDIFENSWDVFKGPFKCPNNAAPNAIDHIYVSPEVQVPEWKDVENPGSDHPVRWIHAVIPGAGGTGPVPYKNPVFEGNTPDPTTGREEGSDYHVYSTGFRHLTSPDLVHWDDKGFDVFKGGYPGNLGENRWAPDIVKTGDHFTLMYSGGSIKFIGYATDPSISGPFDNQGGIIGELPGRGPTIDPNLFPLGGNDYVLYWGSYNGGLSAMKMRLEGNKLVKAGDMKFVMDGDQDNFTTEAPYVIKREQYYYMFYSVGNAYVRGDYAVRIARSTSPFGKFQKMPGDNTILRSGPVFVGPGHNSVAVDNAGNDWIVYHARRRVGSMDRMLMIDPITWSNGWPRIRNGVPSSGLQQDGPANGGDDSSVSGNGQWPLKKSDWPGGVFDCNFRYDSEGGTVHTGIDISVPSGTPVYAEFDGVATRPSDGYGMVNIKFKKGGKTLYFNHQHLSRIDIHDGQNVKAGDRIGLSGSTGTTSPHLHLSVWDLPILSGHIAASSPQGLETLSHMRHPLAFLPDDGRNVSECREPYVVD